MAPDGFFVLFVDKKSVPAYNRREIERKKRTEMSEILEIVMVVAFGASWPLNVVKSYRARTTKGQSLPFLCLIFCGYIAGIAAKFSNEAYMSAFSSKWYVLVFYFINLTMVGIDLLIYARNARLDRIAKKAA